MLENTYWHAYYDPMIIQRSDALRSEYCIEIGDLNLHVDAYLQTRVDAPVILITHGEGGYARMFILQALELYERGFSVLVLDQRGHGASSAGGRSFTLADLTEDVLNAVHWARRSFQGPLFLAGANLGGALAYQATALGAPVFGLICHELYDLGSRDEALSVSRFAKLAGVPGGAAFAAAAARTLMAISPRMKLDRDALFSFNGVLDERDNGRYEAWVDDPNPARTVTPGYAVSTFSSPAAVPYEENKMPILVINPVRDHMISPEITRHNFARLGGPKTCVEMDYGHWSMIQPFAREWAEVVAGWANKILEG